MTGMADHAKPGPRRDHLWVVVLIAACALIEVWASWLGIGAVSGFPKLGKMTTGWILPVTTEAYWAYALYAWLGGAAGPRSRRFAMGSAVAMFILSLGGQESGHLLAAAHRAAPWPVVALVTALPLIAVGLIAILVHLRQADREEATEAQWRAAEAARLAEDERIAADEGTELRRQLAALQGDAEAAIGAARAERDTALRQAQEAAEAAADFAVRAQATAGRQAEADEELSGLRAKVSALEEARDTAEADLAQTGRRAEAAEAKAERLSRRLGANSGAKGSRNTGAKDEAKSRTTVPNDVDARAQALMILAAEPDITGRELGERCGRGERWGQLRKSELAGHVADGTSSAPGSSE